MKTITKRFFIILIIITLFILSYNLYYGCHDKNNHNDGKCDTCGRKATIKTSNNELCDKCFNDFWKWLENEQKKK